MMKELIFFNEKQYSFLKKKYEEKGFILVSFSEYSDIESIIELQDDNRKIVIDLSPVSLDSLLNNGLMINFEKLITTFPENTIFIAERQTDDYKYKLRYCFEHFIDFKTDIIKLDEPSENIREAKKIIDLDKQELDEFFIEFNRKLYGHDKFKKDLKEIIETFRVFNGINEHDILSLFLMGDSGVGKTEVAYSIYKSLGGQKQLTKINFGNYSSKDSLNSLIGSPRGYIGSDGGEFFKRINNSDIGVILIDEFEKANTAVFNYFLDILETGKAVNSLGKEIELNGYIIIFTSNVAREKFTETFSPELISRFDYKGYFDLLTTSTKENYVNERFKKIICKYNKKHGTRFNSRTRENLSSKINVSKYQNMRMMNRKIRSTFVEHLEKSEKI